MDLIEQLKRDGHAYVRIDYANPRRFSEWRDSQDEKQLAAQIRAAADLAGVNVMTHTIRNREARESWVLVHTFTTSVDCGRCLRERRGAHSRWYVDRGQRRRRRNGTGLVGARRSS